MNPHLVLSSLLGVNKHYVALSKQMLLYYSKWPISEFVLTLNGTESDIWDFRQFLNQFDVQAKIFTATACYNNRRQARWSNQRQSYIWRKYSTQDWKLTVDSDEILELSDALLWILDTTMCSYFLGFIVDMIPIIPSDVTSSDGLLFERPHFKCFLTQAIALAQKVPLARAHVLVGGAAHDVARRYKGMPRYPDVLPIFHYKWGDDIHLRLLERFEYYRQIGIPYSDESILFSQRLQKGIDDLLVDDLESVRLIIGPDKTGDNSLKLDPTGNLHFFTPIQLSI